MKNSEGDTNSTAGLISRVPELKEIRDEIASWPSYSGWDRGAVGELINRAALSLFLWKWRGQDDSLSAIADQFLSAAGTLITEQMAELTCCGTLGDGWHEYKQETVICASAALVTWLDQQRVLEQFSREYFGQASDNWPAVAEALVTDALEGRKDWKHRDVDHPVGWVSRRAQIIAKEEFAAGGDIPTRDALSRNTVSLDVVAETPGEAVLGPRFTSASIEALISAANSDEDLRQYLKFRLRPGWKKAVIWRALGWTEDHGRAVDRKFRRLRNTLKQAGAGMEVKSESVIRGVSDASCTVAFERFFDGHGTYKFLDKEQGVENKE
jgi:hypothetical protein